MAGGSAKQHDAEQAAIEAEIRRVFAGVTRQGGISWNQAEALDFHWDDENAIAEAANLDTEARWEDLADDADWIPDRTIGQWPFLDEIGTRYYLAPFMIRCLRLGFCASAGNPFAITSKFKEEKLALLNRAQRRIAARFVRFMIFLTNDEEWSFSYKVYWRDHDAGTPL